MKKKILAVFLAGSLTLSSSCGLLLHPERQGQTSGKLDPVVIGLNMVGLVFYVIPGLVAFAVDYSSGTIYLPNSSSSITPESIKSKSSLGENFKKIHAKKGATQGEIEAVLEQHFNRAIDLNDKRNVAIKVENMTKSDFAALRQSAVLFSVY